MATAFRLHEAGVIEQDVGAEKVAIVVPQPGKPTVTVWLAPSESRPSSTRVTELLPLETIWLMEVAPGMLAVSVPDSVLVRLTTTEAE